MSELIPDKISMSLGSKVYHDLKKRSQQADNFIKIYITYLACHEVDEPYDPCHMAMKLCADYVMFRNSEDIRIYNRDSEEKGGKIFYDEEDITTFFATCDEFDEVDCYYLTHLPESFGKLRALITLAIDNCKNLTHFPESLRHLSALTTLDIQYCNNLTHLPESIGNLPPLTTLDIQYCNNLTHLPNSIDNVPPLTTLDIQYCKNVPGSFHQVVKNATSRAKLAYRAHFNAAASATTATDPAFTAAAAHAATTKHDLNLARARAAARH